MLEEYIYVLGSQKRSLLGRQACETLCLIRRVSVDTVEPAEIYHFVADCREETPCWKSTYTFLEVRRGHY